MSHQLCHGSKVYASHHRYAQLASALPEAGGAYVYLRHFYGERVAFLYGWMSITVMDCGLSAALSVGASTYLAALFPLAGTWPRMVGALLLILLAYINYRGTKISGRLVATTNLLKLGVIAGLIIFAFVSGNGPTANLYPLGARRVGSDPLVIAISGAFISAFFPRPHTRPPRRMFNFCGNSVGQSHRSPRLFT